MIIDQHILDVLTTRAKSLPRLRINLDRRGERKALLAIANRASSREAIQSEQCVS